ncbi:MAG TPA: hypothetical protein VHL34_02270 [Rhizomicrobium sp.]|jgi:capsular polysaccharide transport system permease protein|nr:hypothetical protein [Rhizomicrobium sp.]
MLEAARNQGNVIYAIAIREMEAQYGKMQLGYFWAIAEPSIWVAMMLILHIFIKSLVGVSNMPALTFTVTGVMPYLLVVRTWQSIGTAIDGNGPLLTLPRVTPLDLVLSRSLVFLCTYGTTFVIFIVIATWIEGTWPPERPFEVIFIFICAWLFGIAVGFGTMPLIRAYPSLDHFTMFVRRTFLWTGGVWAPIVNFPTSTWPYLMMNPLFHLTELMRSAWFKSYETPTGNIGYVLAVILVLLTIGVTAERIIRRMK